MIVVNVSAKVIASATATCIVVVGYILRDIERGLPLHRPVA